MARIYAAPTDLPERWRAHPDAADLIRRASLLVTRAIESSVFHTDEDGMPTGEPREACRDAVIAQVSTWLSTGVNPITGYASKSRTITSKGSNGTTVAYAPDTALDAYLNRLAGGRELTDDATLFLEEAGILGVVLHTPGARRLYRPVPSPDTLIDGGEG